MEAATHQRKAQGQNPVLEKGTTGVTHHQSLGAESELAPGLRTLRIRACGCCCLLDWWGEGCSNHNWSITVALVRLSLFLLVQHLSGEANKVLQQIQSEPNFTHAKMQYLDIDKDGVHDVMEALGVQASLVHVIVCA